MKNKIYLIIIALFMCLSLTACSDSSSSSSSWDLTDAQKTALSELSGLSIQGVTSL